MAKSRKLEETLAVLNQLRDDPTSDTAIDGLRQVLRSKYSVAVAQAAKMIAEFEITQLTPDLATVFARFMSNSVENDMGCVAKFRIAEALYRMEYAEETIFLQGIRHVQMEPVWGGREDTAAGLRGICALGLVRMNYPDVLSELADLLADPIPSARAAAVKAIAYNGSAQGVPLLRLKVRIGDKDLQVLSECFTALLKLAPTQSIPLVASYLEADTEQICSMAALALGESRSNEVFDILRGWWERTASTELRRTGLLAIAMLRHDQPLEFLLWLISDGASRDARDAIAALSIYRQEDVLWQRVCQTAEKRGDASVFEAIDRQGLLT